MQAGEYRHGFGGWRRSTIDAAKFIAAGACADIDPWEFIKNRAPIERALPVITVLTIAATGSEMDNCGVISNPETNDKIGRGDYKLVPKASFLDPTVTYSVSAYQTACGAADIISHICEVYFNTEKDLYMLDGFMEVLFKTVIKYAPIAIAKPDDYEARANLMWASSWAINGFLDGGRTLAWSCHPMEHQLSAYYDITHGLGLAILTPRWMRHCLNDATAPRLARFARTVFSVDNALDDAEAANAGIERLSEFLFTTLGLKSTLSAIGIDQTHFDAMAEKACGAGGVIEGFVPLKKQDVLDIYRMSL